MNDSLRAHAVSFPGTEHECVVRIDYIHVRHLWHQARGGARTRVRGLFFNMYARTSVSVARVDASLIAVRRLHADAHTVAGSNT